MKKPELKDHDSEEELKKEILLISRSTYAKWIKQYNEEGKERLKKHGSGRIEWRKGKIVTIIDEQALELAHVIKGIKSNFKGFVGRF